MKTYFFFLGSNPALSATECVRVLAAEKHDFRVVHGCDQFLMVTTKKSIDDALITRLGGITRIAECIIEWDKKPTVEDVITALSPLPAKWRVGISVIGMKSYGMQFAKDFKKQARLNNSRLAFILPKGSSTQLNTAQVLFNNLCIHPHAELTFISHRDTFYLARTCQVQDIQLYELRDTSRPARDAKVGMLPPKLAQIMVNIAASECKEKSLNILDPFCGTGTVLQEGWLLGHTMVGSDSSERMMAASLENLEWVSKQYDLSFDALPECTPHDVLHPFPEIWNTRFDAVVTEPHLGSPLSSPLPRMAAEEYLQSVLPLYMSFFRHAYNILKPHGMILFLFPVIRSEKGSFTDIPTTAFDEIHSFGYNMKQLVPQEIQQYFPAHERNTIIYARPDAVVGRELTLWEKFV